MTKNKLKEPSAVTYAFIANILYFIICAIYCKINSQNQVFNICFLSLCVLLWFITGNVYSRKLSKIDLKKYLSFILISFMPILIFLITYNILINVQIKSQTYNWIMYYSIGAPIIFWIKPASFLINILNINFYLFAYTILAAFMLACFFGLLSSGKNRKARTVKMLKNDKKQSNSFNSEAAVTAENEPHFQNNDNTSNALEYDDGTQQIIFDELNTNKDEFSIDKSDTMSDNSGLKQ
ncbi:MAG: hypothetical protein AAGU14_04015 [Eubacteriaceae bacterium]